MAEAGKDDTGSDLDALGIQVIGSQPGAAQHKQQLGGYSVLVLSGTDLTILDMVGPEFVGEL